MKIDNHTRLMGIIGHPLEHSLSPSMHNPTLAGMGFNGVYLPMEVAPDHLGEAVAGIRALNMLGVNVTVPYKQAVIQYLDKLSPEAGACGAVNLIKNERGQLIGYNTDGRGFMASLAEAGVNSFSQVLIIGAGGAAYSVAYELACAGADHIQALDVDESKAGQLAQFINGLPGGIGSGARMDEKLFGDLSREADLIINCAPVGMHPHLEQSPVSSLDQAKPSAVIYDLIYNPLTTRFLAMGQARGLKTINGLSMLVHQGALTLEILTGIKAPVDYMKEVVSHKLEEC